MALQGSGQISMNDIRVELGQSQGNNSLDYMSQLVGKTAPHAMSEFYGFSNVTLTEETITSGIPDQGLACQYGPMLSTQTVYSTTRPISVGGYVYANSTGTQPLGQGDNWFYDVVNNQAAFILNDGYVQEVVRC